MRKLIPALLIAAFAYSIWMGYSPNYLIKTALERQDTSRQIETDIELSEAEMRRQDKARRDAQLRRRLNREVDEAYQALVDKARENDARRADERFQKILDEAKELERKASN